MTAVAVTRVVNACVLLELGDATFLTDPCFAPPWPLRFTEPVGIEVDALPPLAAVLGGHRVPDHWHLGDLRRMKGRADTPVYVASRGMARQARRVGFPHVEVLHWGDERELQGGVQLRCVAGERITGMRTNAWLLSSGDTTVLVATEARGLGAIRDLVGHTQVDVALLPVNGATLLGRRLVMDATTAVEAARLLGAPVLVAIHDAQAPVPGLFGSPSRFAHLPPADDVRIVATRTGTRVVVG